MPVVIDNPILNLPFREPARHFRFDQDGITNEIETGEERPALRLTQEGRSGPQPVRDPGRQEVIQRQQKQNLPSPPWSSEGRFAVRTTIVYACANWAKCGASNCPRSGEARGSSIVILPFTTR